ncbi:MAG: hypothetical protein AB7Q97_10930 [Gammaproteobacteria bacterium]
MSADPITEPKLRFATVVTFQQTCGHCGCVFQVEVERHRAERDLQEYSCPECHHHTCIVQGPKPPRLTVITTGARQSRAPARAKA